MFTGLVAGQGEVVSFVRTGGDIRMEISPLFTMENPVVGESIAVNGACLTVESWKSRSFTAYVSAESLRATTLGSLRPGNRVNLERAMALGDRLGGHLVSGHVDCTAKVTEMERKGQSHRFRIEFDASLSRQVIPKGSVALDGVSLTVNACGQGFLEVNVIPETLAVTSLGTWAPGVEVNMETDMIGKYIVRMLEPAMADSAEPTEPEGLTMEFLRRHGF